MLITNENAGQNTVGSNVSSLVCNFVITIMKRKPAQTEFSVLWHSVLNRFHCTSHRSRHTQLSVPNALEHKLAYS
jgi:hypothetical protein